MVLFLEAYYERTGSDCVGALLASLMRLEDEELIDPEIWKEWLVCVKQVLEE